MEVIAGRKRHFPSDAAAVTFIEPHLRVAIDEVMVKGAQIAKWLRPIVRDFAKKGRSISWVTPTGFPVLNDYRRKRLHRVKTLRHALVLYERPSDGKHDTVKEIDSVVAHLIHSLDAAHMMLTVLALRQEGLADFAMVHDSYAVHACDVDLMQKVLREQFVCVHTDFTLAKLAEQIRRAASDIPITDPPALGKLDLDIVRDSPFFFS